MKLADILKINKPRRSGRAMLGQACNDKARFCNYNNRTIVLRKISRKSLRLIDYDYSREGAYFITTCIHKRNSILGKINNKNVELSQIGYLLEKWWNKIPDKFPSTQIDEFVIMPNHFHGVIFVLESDPDLEQEKVSLPGLLQWFKAMTGNEYSRLLRKSSTLDTGRKLWQRSYYDHIVRNEEELGRIRNYIINNPLKWHLDRENPESANFNIDHDEYFAETYD